MWLSCLLPAAPVHIPPSDGKIYKYPQWAFECVYAISCTAISWQRKIVAMTYGVTPHTFMFVFDHCCLLQSSPFLSLFNVSSISAISGSSAGTVWVWCVGWSATLPEFQGQAGDNILLAATSVLETKRNHKGPAKLGKH